MSIVDEPFRLADLVHAEDERASALHVRFPAPTTLKRDGQLVREPAFGDLIRRARDRLSTLATFFGDGPLEIDFAAIGRAEARGNRWGVAALWIIAASLMIMLVRGFA